MDDGEFECRRPRRAAGRAAPESKPWDDAPQQTAFSREEAAGNCEGAVEGEAPAALETSGEFMSYLAQLIAKKEGFGLPGKIPTTHHNPGDLRHSPHSVHSSRSGGGGPDAIGTIDTDAHGWEDLERQLSLYAKRGLTLREMIVDYYAPEGENNSEDYLAFVCERLHVPDTTLVSEALLIPDPNPPVPTGSHGGP